MKTLLILSFTIFTLLNSRSYAVIIPNPPELAAKGYMLMDFQSGEVIAENNSRAILAPASLTKLMTAYVVGKEIKSGRLDWQEKVIVSEQAWSVNFQDSSKMFIQPGDQISIANLMRGVIIQSGNDASVALAEHIAGSESAFVSLMNSWAKTLDLQDTHFINSHGLDGEGLRSSPADMAILIRSIITELPDVYQLYSEKQFKWNNIVQYNRNKLLWDEAINVDGGKTGYTENAGYSLVSSATNGNMRLIAVVMGASSKQARISSSKNLLSYGFRFYETKKVADKNQIEKTVRVWKGDKKEVSLKLVSDAYIVLPRTKSDVLEKSIMINEPLIAPISKGQEIGQMVWYRDGEKLATFALVSNENISEASFVNKILDTIQLWFSDLYNNFLSKVEGV